MTVLTPAQKPVARTNCALHISSLATTYSLQLSSIAGKESSLVPKRHQRIDFRGPPRGDVTREQCNENQQARDSREGRRVGRAHAKQQTRYQTRQGKRARQTCGDSDQRQSHSVSDNQLQYITRLCAKGHSYADLVGALCGAV